MKTRILSGLILAPLLIIVYIGGYVLQAACLIIGIIGVREFYSAFKSAGIKPSFTVGAILTFALYAIINIGSNSQWMMMWFFAVIMASLLYLFIDFPARRLEDALVTAVGVLYIPFFSIHVALTERTPYGILVWLILLTAFGTDIFAYFSGYLFGKHKLCPEISPKKTIEGSVGGTIGSVALCTAFALVFAPELLMHSVIIGILGGIISQFGDLTASIFKRKLGIKDYGNLIPGHGGILDRFDSILFTAPMVYYYIVFFMM